MPRFVRLPDLLRKRRSAVTADVDAEIASHLEERVRALIATGMSPEDARAEALRRFGDLSHTRREMTGSALRLFGRVRRRDRFEAFFADARHTVRQLRRSPGFSVGVILTLGLGIGANAAMFDVLDRLLLRAPAHVVDPGRVSRVYLHERDGAQEVTTTEVSYLRFRELREAARGLIDLSAQYEGPVVAGTGDEARSVRGGLVSANFWSMLGVRPAFGRLFVESDEAGQEGEAVAVLGHGYWRSSFGADSTVIGRTIDLGARRFTIVGVAPPAFSGIGLFGIDVWMPVTAGRAIFRHLPPEWTGQHDFSWLSLAGRLEDGATSPQVEAALGTAYRRSHEAQTSRRRGGPGDSRSERAIQSPPQDHTRASLWPVLLERGPERNDGTRVALWLGAVAVIVLLLACANVANLLLARGLRRRAEIAVRVALGVSRGRLIRQLLFESVLLAALGGAAGVAIAAAGGGALRALLLPGVTEAGAIGGRLLVYTILAAFVACLVSGLGPAFYASRPDLRGMLSAANRGSAQRSRLRTGLLIGQAAMSTVLLVGAGLFVRSLSEARSTDLGFDADRLLVVRIQLRSNQPIAGGQSRVLREFAEHLRSVPGVLGATTTLQIPFGTSGNTYIAVPGIDSVERFGQFRMNGVGTRYFATTGTRILSGRGLIDEDRAGAPLVVVVSDSMARVLWPSESALGKCVKVGGPERPCSEVVGVAANVHQYEVRAEPSLQYWFPEVQEQGGNSGAFGVMVRVEDPRAMVQTIRRALLPLTPASGFVTVRPVSASVDAVLRPWRLGASMFGVFGAVGLVIAAVGLYSVLAYVVDQRRRELGIRVALGAPGRRVIALVVGQGVMVSGSGIVIGLLAAVMAAPRLKPLLVGVGPRDPIVLGLVVVTLVAAAIVASVVPAWRAARVDPVQALRAE